MASIQLEFNKAINKTLSNILVFYVAIYVRLSKAEEGKSKEEQSRSITNQKNIAINYLNSIMESDAGIIKYVFVDYYVDDGVSGSTFDRPDFNRLKEDIISKRINMVIVKDLSRLGREHIESDEYLEKWFPEHDTRCVAILDNIDTFSESANNEIAPILNWANERHNKETSKKIKKTFRDNINAGLYMGSEAPYGLIKGNTEETKHQLTVDEEIRPIIVDIYEKAKQEWSYNKIAEYLTNKGIPIPSIHKKSNRGVKTKTFELWDPNTVKDILTNEMYIGNMVQGKTTRLSLKSKKITYIPKEDWVVVENTHEAIIDRDTFNLVQEIVAKNSHQQENSNYYLLKGLLICKECGHTLSIQKNKNAKQAYTVCNYYKKHSKYDVCTSHRFNYRVIEENILNSIREECKKYVDSTNFEKLLRDKEKSKNKIDETKLLIKKSQNTIERYKKQIQTTYMDKLNEKIDDDIFQETQQNLKKKISDEENIIQELKKTLEILTTKIYDEPNYKKVIEKYLSFENPERTLLLQIINKIEISQDGSTDIYYKMKTPFK